MLQDDSGEISPVKLDTGLISSENAIIVLDEYNDICWTWIGREVNMPTRMHALRMSKSVQKSGYHIGTTTIGMATSKLVEMMEKNDSNSEVASDIAAFKEAMKIRWKFDDEVLAYDPTRTKGYEASAPSIRDTAPKLPTTEPEPTHLVATTIEEPVATPFVSIKPAVPARRPSGGAQYEKKAAFLLYSVVKHADLVYTEKIQRDGKSGMKIEAPAVVMLEVLNDSDNIVISPSNFGDSEAAAKIRAEYESWLDRI